MIDKDFLKTHLVYEIISFQDTRGRICYRLFDPITEQFGEGFLKDAEAFDLAEGRSINELDRDALHERQRARYNKEHEIAIMKRHEQWLLRYSAYSRYINESPEWRERRSKVLTRDNHTCQAVLPGCCNVRADHVHHKTYAHLGKEPLFDLVAVCARCHASLHALEATCANPT